MIEEEISEAECTTCGWLIYDVAESVARHELVRHIALAHDIPRKVLL